MPKPAGNHSRVFRNSLISLAFTCVLTPSATVAETTNAPAASGVTSMRLQPLDNAASPAFMGVWEPYVDGNWLSFDLDFTNGPSAIELREARVRYRDAGGAEVASVTVGQADLAFATLSRGSAPGTFGKTGGTLSDMGPDNQCVHDMAFDPDDLLYAAGSGTKDPIQPFVELSPDGVLVARYNGRRRA